MWKKIIESRCRRTQKSGGKWKGNYKTSYFIIYLMSNGYAVYFGSLQLEPFSNPRYAEVPGKIFKGEDFLVSILFGAVLIWKLRKKRKKGGYTVRSVLFFRL
jgi:hypothetical protein